MAHQMDFNDPDRWLWYILHGEPRRLHAHWLGTYVVLAARNAKLIDYELSTEVCTVLEPEKLVELCVEAGAVSREKADYYLTIATLELAE